MNNQVGPIVRNLTAIDCIADLVACDCEVFLRLNLVDKHPDDVPNARFMSFHVKLDDNLARIFQPVFVV